MSYLRRLVDAVRIHFVGNSRDHVRPFTTRQRARVGAIAQQISYFMRVSGFGLYYAPWCPMTVKCDRTKDSHREA